MSDTRPARRPVASHMIRQKVSVKGVFGRANALRDSVWDTDEEERARPSCSMLLITAVTSEQVEALARRIHRGGIGRSKKPFLLISAADLPADPEALRTACEVWVRAASGGTILFADVEEIPPAVQHQFAELMAGQDPLKSSAGVRVIAGTTASLVDLVANGRFSDVLFYRLNIIHIVVNDEVTRSNTSQTRVF